MRLVLWPNHLLGGFLTRTGGGIAAAEQGEAGLAGNVRNMLGRWPDADVVLQQGMSEGLRDWDLWYVIEQFCANGIANRIQGTTSVLPSPESVPIVSRFARPEISRLLWSLCSRMDGRGCGHFADQTPRRQYVSQLRAICHELRLICFSSFFQSVCIIGYTLFPLVIASLLSALHIPVIVRIPVYSVLALWSLAAGVSILGGSGVLKNRVALAIYPLFLFYVGLTCLCLIS